MGINIYDVLDSTGQQEFIHPFKGGSRINIWYGSDSQKFYDFIRKIKVKHIKQW